MSVRGKIYILPPEGGIMRVSQALIDPLIHGEIGWPDYAGRRLQVVEVVIEYRDRKAIRMIRAVGSHWIFDSYGMISKHLQMQAMLSLENAFANEKRETRVTFDGWNVGLNVLNEIYSDLHLRPIEQH